MRKGIVLIMLLLGFSAMEIQAAGRNPKSGAPAWMRHEQRQASWYFFPEIGTYYNVSQRQFVYQDRGRWVSNQNLASVHRNYDLNSARKVAINENDPFRNHQYYASRFAGNSTGQVMIRDTRSARGSQKMQNEGKRYSKDDGNRRGRDDRSRR
ncbi:MAG: hypothetical protein EOP49_16240 [Sphingobacteriales bacterium]|nr:MAG: hypothetical protein EOP49_16240 [Sphingobacteriales bacterium]